MPHINRTASRVGCVPSLAVVNSRLVLFLALASIPGPLSGQASQGRPHKPVYVTLGYGVGSLGAAGQVGLSVHRPLAECTLRFAYTVEPVLFGQPDDAGDLGLLCGVKRPASNGWFGLGAGPSIAWTNAYRCSERSGWFQCSSYELKSRAGPGLAFHATIGWALSKAFGISVSAVGDANAAHSFKAATLNLHLGRLR